MNISKLLIAAVAALATTSAFAADWNSSIGYGSDYIWRGQSKSDGARVLTFGTTVTSENGVYGTLNAYNGVDFPAESAESNELDLSLGFTRDLGGDVSFDVGYTRHAMPGDSDAQINEIYAGVGYGPYNAKLYKVVGEALGSDDWASYIVGSVDVNKIIPGMENVPVDVSFFYGTQLENDSATDRINDYGINVSKTFEAGVSASYQFSHYSLTDEGTHIIGLNYNF